MKPPFANHSDEDAFGPEIGGLLEECERKGYHALEFGQRKFWHIARGGWRFWHLGEGKAWPWPLPKLRPFDQLLADVPDVPLWWLDLEHLPVLCSVRISEDTHRPRLPPVVEVKLVGEDDEETVEIKGKGREKREIFTLRKGRPLSPEEAQSEDVEERVDVHFDASGEAAIFYFCYPDETPVGKTWKFRRPVHANSRYFGGRFWMPGNASEEEIIEEAAGSDWLLRMPPRPRWSRLSRREVHSRDGVFCGVVSRWDLGGGWRARVIRREAAWTPEEWQTWRRRVEQGDPLFVVTRRHLTRGKPILSVASVAAFIEECERRLLDPAGPIPPTDVPRWQERLGHARRLLLEVGRAEKAGDDEALREARDRLSGALEDLRWMPHEASWKLAEHMGRSSGRKLDDNPLKRWLVALCGEMFRCDPQVTTRKVLMEVRRKEKEQKSKVLLIKFGEKPKTWTLRFDNDRKFNDDDDKKIELAWESLRKAIGATLKALRRG